MEPLSKGHQNKSAISVETQIRVERALDASNDGVHDGQSFKFIDSGVYPQLALIGDCSCSICSSE